MSIVAVLGPDSFAVGAPQPVFELLVRRAAGSGALHLGTLHLALHLALDLIARLWLKWRVLHEDYDFEPISDLLDSRVLEHLVEE